MPPDDNPEDAPPQSVPPPPITGFIATRLIDITRRTVEQQQLADQMPELLADDPSTPPRPDPGWEEPQKTEPAVSAGNETASASGDMVWELVDDDGQPVANGGPRAASGQQGESQPQAGAVNGRQAGITETWTPERPSDSSRAPAETVDGRHLHTRPGEHSLWRLPFLAALKLCPNIRGACEAAGVKRGTVDDARERDPVFRAQVKAAFRDGVDLLHMAIWQRAVGGVQRPVYQGGVCVGHVIEYSDRLAEFLLKGHAKDSESGTFTDAPLIQIQQTVVASPQAVTARAKALSPIVQRLAAGALRTAGQPVNPLADG